MTTEASGEAGDSPPAFKAMMRYRYVELGWTEESTKDELFAGRLVRTTNGFSPSARSTRKPLSFVDVFTHVRETFCGLVDVAVAAAGAVGADGGGGVTTTGGV